jgi:hypothetical protein
MTKSPSKSMATAETRWVLEMVLAMNSPPAGAPAAVYRRA